MRKRISIHCAATLAVLLATAFIGAFAVRRVPEPILVPLDQIQMQIAGWNALPDHRLPSFTLRALDPTSYLLRTYRKGSSELDLFIAYYSQQRAGESMHSPKHCLPGAGWEILEQGSAQLHVENQDLPINKYIVVNGSSRMLVFYWYQSSQRIIASEYVGKLMLAKDTLLTGRTAGSIVRITLPDVPGASDQAIDFAAHIIPEVHRCFTRQDSLKISAAASRL